MIRFPCACQHHHFEVDEEFAGRQLQCPKCGRLNDVPTLSDLASISDDGTYKMDATIDRHEAAEDRLAQLQRAFARTRVDEWGREIDLRPTMDDVLAANAVIPGPDSGEPFRPGAPKYDPVTGELVREMELRSDPRLTQPGVPVARRTISYAGHEPGEPVSIGGIFMGLFTLPNVIVMMFTFITHIFIQLMAVSALIGMLIVVPIAFVIVMCMIAHYANVVDETGPEGRDELPRPLRQMSWHDDLWGSFVNFSTAVVACYGPWIAIAVWYPLPLAAQGMLLGTGLVVGTVAFPAGLLTSTTSGTWMNLRPDRLLGVIKAIGPVYIFAVLLWIVAAATYVAGFIATNMTIISFLGGSFSGAWAVIAHWAVSYPLLLVGIYLMHAFCWLMGIQYRKHHDAFPWVLQRYTKAPAKTPPPKGGRHGFSVVTAQQQQRPAPPRAAAAPVPVVAPKPVQPLPAIDAVDPDDEEMKRVVLEQRRARMLQQNKEMNLVHPPQSVLPMDDAPPPQPKQDDGRGFPLD